MPRTSEKGMQCPGTLRRELPEKRCLPTGVFRFPDKRAAEIAVSTTEQWLKEHSHVIDRVVFNVFKNEDRMYYEQLIRRKP